MSTLNYSCLLAFGFSPGPPEMLIILIVALLLYGGRLPEVARSWGKSLAEFRRGLSGIQNEINDAIYSTPDQLEYYPEETSYPNESAEETGSYDAASPDDGASENLSANDAVAKEESPADKRTVNESD